MTKQAEHREHLGPRSRQPLSQPRKGGNRLNKTQEQRKPPLNLFLSSGGLISLVLGSLLPNSGIPGVTSGVSEFPVSGLLALWKIGLLDLADGPITGDDGEQRIDILGGVGLALLESNLSLLDLLGCGVELLELSTTAGEQDKTGLESLQTGNVGSEGLGAGIGTAVVDGNADGWSKLAGNTSLL